MSMGRLDHAVATGYRVLVGLYRRRSLILFACLVMAVTSVGADFLPHTDDGCATEIHCTVCLTTLAGRVIEVAAPLLAPAAATERPIWERAAHPSDTRTPRTLTLRGPPAA